MDTEQLTKGMEVLRLGDTSQKLVHVDTNVCSEQQGVHYQELQGASIQHLDGTKQATAKTTTMAAT